MAPPKYNRLLKCIILQDFLRDRLPLHIKLKSQEIMKIFARRILRILKRLLGYINLLLAELLT
jgi:hypothetical protein